MGRTRTYFSNQLYEDYEKTQTKLEKVTEDYNKVNSELNFMKKNLKQEMKEFNQLLSLEFKKYQKEFKKELTKTLKKENEQLKETINELTTELKKANELIERLRLENEKLKGIINKDSTNSSKPSSTNIVTPKRTGANLYNGRKKTNKKVGGQKGHKGTTLSKDKIEKIIKEKNLEVKEIKHYIKGNEKKGNLIKYKIGLTINPVIEKHIFIYKEEATRSLPIEYYTDVTYDNSIKALAIELGAYNVISYDRLSDFFNVITDGIINISTGTLVNIINEFSNKSEATIENITNNLILGHSIHTDETSSKFNGKNSFIRVYDNKMSALYKAHLKKGHKPIKEDNILPGYTGTIISDHDTTVYKYGNRHGECNIHLGRYLEEIIQNIKGIKFAKEMKKLLFQTNREKKKLLSNDIKEFNKEYLQNIDEQFDKILKEGRKELGELKSSFYLEKAMTLINRLEKYKENHLLFVYDFEIEFDNNMSEQDLRIYKTKTKVSGGFRSLKGQDSFANALSIIKTSIKRKINPYKSIQDIFNNKVLFAN